MARVSQETATETVPPVSVDDFSLHSERRRSPADVSTSATAARKSWRSLIRRWQNVIYVVSVASALAALAAGGMVARKRIGEPEVLKPEALPGDELLPVEVPEPPVAVVTPPALPAVPKVILPLREYLTQPKFAKFRRDRLLDAEPVMNLLAGGRDDVVFLQGFPIIRGDVADFLRGGMADISLLHVYTVLVEEHIKNRVDLEMQENVAVISPVEFATSWGKFFLNHERPVVAEDVIARSRNASKVLFVLPAPLWDAIDSEFLKATGHFLLAVVDRGNNTFTIVDSLPHQESYYKPIKEFIKSVAQQMSDLKGSALPDYTPSPHIPEPGFPLQAEALPQLRELSYYNACGVFALENMRCVAGNRMPHYAVEDTIGMRIHMVLELIKGLQTRPLAGS